MMNNIKIEMKLYPLAAGALAAGVSGTVRIGTQPHIPLLKVGLEVCWCGLSFSCVRRLENARNGIDRSYHVLSGLS